MSSSTADLRAELAWLRSRYDAGAVPALVYDLIKKLETIIALARTRRAHRSAREARIDDRNRDCDRDRQPPNVRSKTMGTKSDYAYGKSRYLKAEELVGKTVRVVISNVEDVEFDDGECKPVLNFEGKERGLVVNSTNFDILADGLGNNTNDWVGHVIVLKGEKVLFKASASIASACRCRRRKPNSRQSSRTRTRISMTGSRNGTLRHP